MPLPDLPASPPLPTAHPECGRRLRRPLLLFLTCIALVPVILLPAHTVSADRGSGISEEGRNTNDVAARPFTSAAATGGFDDQQNEIQTSLETEYQPTQNDNHNDEPAPDAGSRDPGSRDADDSRIEHSEDDDTAFFSLAEDEIPRHEDNGHDSTVLNAGPAPGSTEAAVGPSYRNQVAIMIPERNINHMASIFRDVLTQRLLVNTQYELGHQLWGLRLHRLHAHNITIPSWDNTPLVRIRDGRFHLHVERATFQASLEYTSNNINTAVGWALWYSTYAKWHRLVIPSWVMDSISFQKNRINVNLTRVSFSAVIRASNRKKDASAGPSSSPWRLWSARSSPSSETSDFTDVFQLNIESFKLISVNGKAPSKSAVQWAVDAVISRFTDTLKFLLNLAVGLVNDQIRGFYRQFNAILCDLHKFAEVEMPVIQPLNADLTTRDSIFALSSDVALVPEELPLNEQRLDRRWLKWPQQIFNANNNSTTCSDKRSKAKASVEKGFMLVHRLLDRYESTHMSLKQFSHRLSKPSWWPSWHRRSNNEVPPDIMEVSDNTTIIDNTAQILEDMTTELSSASSHRLLRRDRPRASFPSHHASFPDPLTNIQALVRQQAVGYALWLYFRMLTKLYGQEIHHIDDLASPIRYLKIDTFEVPSVWRPNFVCIVRKRNVPSSHDDPAQAPDQENTCGPQHPDGELRLKLALRNSHIKILLTPATTLRFGFNMARRFAFPIITDHTSATFAVEVADANIDAYFRAAEDGKGLLGLELEAVKVHSLKFPSAPEVVNEEREWRNLDDNHKRWLEWTLRKIFGIALVGWANGLSKVQSVGETMTNVFLGLPENVQEVNRREVKQLGALPTQARFSIHKVQLRLLEGGVLIYSKGAELHEVPRPLAPRLFERVLAWVFARVKDVLYFIAQSLSKVFLAAPFDEQAFVPSDSGQNRMDATGNSNAPRARLVRRYGDSNELGELGKSVEAAFAHFQESRNMTALRAYLDRLEQHLFERIESQSRQC